MADIATYFRDAALSNWQSAVASVAAAQTRLGSANPFVMATRPALLDPHNTFVQADTTAAKAHLEELDGNVDHGLIVNTVERCAKAALDVAMAHVNGDHAAETAAQAILSGYGTCDKGWAECIVQFIAHYTGTNHGTVPYKKWVNPDDFVLAPELLPTQCTIAVIGDWGTGDVRAQTLLSYIARKHQPDILIHLGDIYYSCTLSEANLFYANVISAFPSAKKAAYTVCGNHDMYAGGAPYYALLDRLHQPASFFCLRNANWQILAADTGYNDFNPGRGGGVASWVRDHDNDEDYSELEWHRDKLTNAEGRGTILLTHHQPFTLNSAIDGHAVNARLLGQFAPYLPQINLWLWGHEHNQVIYKPFKGLSRGRCIGASAIPVPSSDNLYTADPAIQGEELPELDGAPTTNLRVDTATQLYNLGYALMEFDGAQCAAKYFEYNSSSSRGRIMFHENLHETVPGA